MYPTYIFTNFTPQEIKNKTDKESNRHSPPPIALILSLLAILFICIPILSFSQTLNFTFSNDEVDVFRNVTITNTSEEISSEATYSWNIQYCGFYYEDAFICNYQSTEETAEFTGKFVFSGTYVVTLFALNEGGDTMEYTPMAKEITINDIDGNIPVNDTCYDTNTFSCIYNNLVCNGDFEWYSSPVSGPSELPLAAPWRSIVEDVDYFNSDCSSGSLFGVPDNLFGSQDSYQSGEAYSGLLTFVDTITNHGFEIAGAELKDTLIKGQPYKVEFWISKADIAAYSCNCIQAYFSDDDPSAASWDLFMNGVDTNYILDPLGDSVISDTNNWIHFSTIFVPDTNNITWISIGRIKEDTDLLFDYDSSLMQTQHYNGAYYLLDFVSVRPEGLLVIVPDTIYGCKTDTIMLQVTGTAGSYLWSNGDTTSSIQFIADADTNIFVTVSDYYNCFDTVLRSIIIIEHLDINDISIIGHNNDCDSIAWYHVDPVPSCLHDFVWTIDTGTGFFQNGNDTIIGTDIDSVLLTWTNLPDLPDYIYLKVEISSEFNTIHDSIKVFTCCDVNEADTIFNNDTITEHVVLGGDTVLINGNLVIDDCIFYLTENLSTHDKGLIYMGPEARIILVDSGSIYIDKSIVKSSCRYMWDGIYANHTDQIISITESEIYDAINAVYANNSVQVKLEKSSFIDNYKNIIIENYNSENHSTFPFKVDSCSFYLDNSSGWDFLIPPHENDATYSGIEIINSDSVGIGDVSYDENYFYNMDFAIIARNSGIWVFNNKFEKIGNRNGVIFPGAIQSITDYGKSFNYITGAYVGENSSGYSNMFDSCGLGVYNVNQHLRDNS